MTDTGTRPGNSSPDTPGLAVPAACPFGRHHTFDDGVTSIVFGYADITKIMERILDIWDHLEDHGHMTDEAGDLFEGLLGHLEMTRRWTGWDGVPGKYLR
jgi:hypothetical protein